MKKARNILHVRFLLNEISNNVENCEKEMTIKTIMIGWMKNCLSLNFRLQLNFRLPFPAEFLSTTEISSTTEQLSTTEISSTTEFMSTTEILCTSELFYY